jgi:siderophore synthetase component
LPEIDVKGKQLAVHASIRGLLNSFLRETGIYDIMSEGDRFLIKLPHSERSIAGQLMHFSMTGQHLYGDTFLAAEKGDSSFQPVVPDRLISIILEEIAYCDQEADRSRRISELNKRIKNSIVKMSFYFTKAIEKSERQPQLNYVRSEQSLLAGHPFHTTP